MVPLYNTTYFHMYTAYADHFIRYTQAKAWEYGMLMRISWYVMVFFYHRSKTEHTPAEVFVEGNPAFFEFLELLLH